MLDAQILFLNHCNDETTHRHLGMVRERNPYPVIPIHQQPADPVPGSIDVGTDPQFDAERPRNWFFCDNLFYQWYRGYGGGARRYIVIESDTLATMPLREFYGELWDAEVAASVAVTRESCPSWHWFQPAQDNLPAELRPSAAGVLPMSGMLFSDAALRTVATSPAMPAGVFCELRLGTLLRYHGIPVRPFTPEQAATVRCDPIRPDRSVPGLYHPVKG